MAKRKSCIAGEFVIERAESGTIAVYKIYDNTKGGLREAAEKAGFEYGPDWTTQQLGAKLIKFVNEAQGVDDNKHCVIGEYSIEKLPSAKISIYKTYANTKGGLREAAEKAGFEYDHDWTTQQLGAKLIDFVNEKKG